MEIQDFFETRQKHYSPADYQMLHDKHKLYKNSNHMEYKPDKIWQSFLIKVNRNPRLRLVLIVSVLILLGLITALIIALIPFLNKIWDATGKNDLQELLNKILKG